MVWTAPTSRNTGDLITSTIWNTDLVDNISFLGVTHDHSGDSGDGGNVTRGMFVSAHATDGGTLSSFARDPFPTTELPDGSTTGAFFMFRIPAKFQTLDLLVIAVQATQSNDYVRDGNIGYAADGQANSTHLNAIASATITLVANQMKEDDITASMLSEAALDLVGIKYRRIGADQKFSGKELT